MNNENIYLSALEQKKTLLRKRKADYSATLNKLALTNDEYRQAVTALSKLGPAISIATISGDKDKLSKLKVESVKYTAIKKEIERREGIKEFSPDCPICKDTGYVGGELCDCVKKMAIKTLIDSASKIAPINTCRFDTFDLDYYEDSLPDGTSPKKKMTVNFKKLKEYTLSFSPTESENLIFYGKTGVGKTHLSLSIMNELLLKGFYVVYDSAYNLFSKIETEHFKLHTDDTYNSAINCDLLIIDDLGSEFVSSYSQSSLYSIINTRLLKRKPTIINTNLTLEGIENQYTPRVSSRIVGEYKGFLFLGNDIRQKKFLKDR